MTLGGTQTVLQWLRGGGWSWHCSFYPMCTLSAGEGFDRGYWTFPFSFAHKHRGVIRSPSQTNPHTHSPVHTSWPACLSSRWSACRSHWNGLKVNDIRKQHVGGGVWGHIESLLPSSSVILRDLLNQGFCLFCF